ncbi:FecR family protein [Dolichospermum flos-aquae]|uniref:FecR domain-containing protein n=1 Tax=Dolichospermum flos-aquae CCAP 1403/13F TaxID=315271 RepID=A0A6H2C1F5_DOLFA|nr:FecR family protein [Dolichospermum flos-aquae]QJB45171.1 FecR domain-containing protein [Dolichospermum flos-aquae CCAP 1403/13F]
MIKKPWLLLSLFFIFLLTFQQALAKNNLHLRVNRYLEVRSIFGNVIYGNQQTSQPANVGTKLQKVGDSISTGKNSRTMLALDTEIAFVEVAENTKLQIQKLHSTSNNGKVTELLVTGGQVRLKVRPLNNRESRLEIKTPAGITGVRGTEFGVIVQPSGKTGVATLKGQVVTSAQGKTVSVNKGFQSLIIPGKPPSPPVRLRDDTILQIKILADMGNQQAKIAGKVDPVNLVILANEPLITNQNGEFEVITALPNNRKIAVSITTPLGKKQKYELAVP